ncbi:hypothetical protein GCM10025768_09610 [Microbacterium pseudoresistens]
MPRLGAWFYGEPIQLIGDRYLTAETAGVREICHPEIEKVQFHLTGSTDSLAEIVPNPHMTRGAGELSTAFTDDPGNSRAHSRAHDALSDRGVDDAIAVAHGVHDLWHAPLLTSQWTNQSTARYHLVKL